MPLVSQVDGRLEQGERFGRVPARSGDNWNKEPGGRDYHVKLRAIRLYHKECRCRRRVRSSRLGASLYGSCKDELERFILTLALGRR